MHQAHQLTANWPQACSMEYWKAKVDLSAALIPRVAKVSVQGLRPSLPATSHYVNFSPLTLRLLSKTVFGLSCSRPAICMFLTRVQSQAKENAASSHPDPR